MAKTNVGNYVIVRTESAGVFAGTVASKDGDVTVLTDARRIWYWDGAASLSELAQLGTTRPENCKFPVAVDEVELHKTIEIISVTERAKESIEGVKPWTKQ